MNEHLGAALQQALFKIICKELDELNANRLRALHETQRTMDAYERGVGGSFLNHCPVCLIPYVGHIPTIYCMCCGDTLQCLRPHCKPIKHIRCICADHDMEHYICAACKKRNEEGH
jgi:hypothetical protein